ncbi:MAG: STN domain-containing protein, partial [Planctomycetota bacterium]
MQKLGRVVKLNAAFAAALSFALLAPAAQRASAGEPRQPDRQPEPEWARAMRRKLERKVSFEFKDTPLTEAIAFLQTLTKVSMIVAPDAAEAKGTTPISLKVTNERLDVALRRILAAAGLDYALAGRAIYVSTPEGVAAAMREEAQVRLVERGIEERAARDGWEPALRKILSRKVTTEFVDTPFLEAVHFLQTLFETTITIDAAVPEEKRRAPVTLKAPSRQFAVALRQICDAVGLDYSVVGRGIVISMPEPEWAREIRRKLERKISFEFVDTPLTEAVAFLQTLTKVSMILDPEGAQGEAERPITLKVTNEPLGVAFRRILALAGLDYALVGHAVFVSTRGRLVKARRAEAERRKDVGPAWAREFRAKLESRKITFEFAETPFTEAIAFIGILARANMIVDPEAAEAKGRTPVTLKVTDMPLDEALGWTCRLAGLDWTFTDQALVISTPERVAELRRRAAAARGEAEEAEWERAIRAKLERKVSFELLDTPLEECVQFLETLTRISMVIGPEAQRRKGAVPITLKVTDQPLGMALRWLCALADVDHALLDGAIYIAAREDIEELEEGRRQEAEARREAGRLPDGVWEVEIRRKFARKVTFEFVDTPLGEALQFLQTLTETTF